MKATYKLEICEDGRKVVSVYIDDYRITGRETKPYGNAKVLRRYTIERDDLRTALGIRKGKT